MSNITPVDNMVQTVSKMKDQFALALPANVDPDRFVRIAQTMIRSNPALQKCSPMSIYSGLLKSAQTGMFCDGVHAALVPFGDTATFMPMIKGIVSKILEAGLVISIEPDIVHANDEFDYYKDETGTKFLHRPNYKGDRGEMILAYSKAVLKDGSLVITVMSKAEVEKVRNSSRGKNSPTWTGWYEEMAKKTVVRRQCKFLPSASDVESMFKGDDETHDVTPFQTQPQATVDNTQPNKLLNAINKGNKNEENKEDII